MVWVTILPLIYYLKDTIKVVKHNISNGNTGKIHKRIDRSRFLVDFLEFCQTCEHCPDDHKVSIDQLKTLQNEVKNLESHVKCMEKKKESIILPPSSSLPQFFDFRFKKLMVGYADYSISPPVVKKFRSIATKKVNSSNPEIVHMCFELAKKLYEQLLANSIIGPLINKQIILYHKGSLAVFLAVKNLLSILKLKDETKKLWETRARSLFNGSDLDVGIVFLKKMKNFVYIIHLVTLLVSKFLYENRNHKIFRDVLRNLSPFEIGDYKVSPYKSHSYSFEPSYPGDPYRSIHCISRPETTFVTYNEVSFVIDGYLTHFHLCRLKTSLKIEGIRDPNYHNNSHGELLDISISCLDDAYGFHQAKEIYGKIKSIEVSLD